MITSAAITTSCTIILILAGIVFLKAEIIKFEKAVTIVTDRAITIAGLSLTVTANAEHIPKICTVTGLYKFSGPVNNFPNLDIVYNV
jgi:uncharacterized membrane protein YozB (DUF420 family)